MTEIITRFEIRHASYIDPNLVGNLFTEMPEHFYQKDDLVDPKLITGKRRIETYLSYKHTFKNVYYIEVVLNNCLDNYFQNKDKLIQLKTLGCSFQINLEIIIFDLNLPGLMISANTMRKMVELEITLSFEFYFESIKEAHQISK